MWAPSTKPARMNWMIANFKAIAKHACHEIETPGRIQVASWFAAELPHGRIGEIPPWAGIYLCRPRRPEGAK
jgi:hypothetical protein